MPGPFIAPSDAQMIRDLIAQSQAQSASQAQRAQAFDMPPQGDDLTAQLQQLGAQYPMGYQGEAMPGMAWGADQERAASLPLIIRAMMGEPVR